MIWEKRITIMTDKKPLDVQYFVSAPSPVEGSDIPCYGIGISAGRETASCATFCPDKSEAIRVCEMLCQSQVTPISFYDVMDAYLSVH